MTQNLFTNIASFIKKDLTSYDIFALTIVLMIVGHVVAIFLPEHEWLWFRVPDRMAVVIFLVSFGYNTGSKPSLLMWLGAIVLEFLDYFYQGAVGSISILGVIIILRYALDPLMNVLLKNKILFWGTSITFMLLSDFTSIFFLYGTMGIIMGMAGWIARNHRNVPKDIVEPKYFFFFAYMAFLAFLYAPLMFSNTQFFFIAIGAAFSMWLMYDFKTLILNAIRRRPKDRIEKVVSFIGHKGLEIYIIHLFVIKLWFLYTVGSH